jgi:folate-binding protein YgfZ
MEDAPLSSKVQMTDIQIQLEAILRGAAFAPLTDRAFLSVTGPDATRWLNGMVSNNIKDLAEGEQNYNFLLNAQGRILGDCTIYRRPTYAEPEFLLETDLGQIEAVHQTLDRFIIMDDVELSRVLTDKFGVLLLGPEIQMVFMQLLTDGDRPSDGSDAASAVEPSIILSRPDSTIPTLELWFDTQSEMERALHRLPTLDATAVSAEALESWRILAATPRYGTDIRNTEAAKDLPQETALDGTQSRALNFNKGCYLGQEIVERIHSRGQVHRTFAQFQLTGPLPQLPAPLQANGKVVGELTSAAIIPLPAGDITLALGYARREALERREPFTYPGGTATKTEPSQHITETKN